MHLLSDAWTVQGVPLFWPIIPGRVKLPPRISTGSWMEAVVLVIATPGLVNLLVTYWWFGELGYSRV